MIEQRIWHEGSIKKRKRRGGGDNWLIEPLIINNIEGIEENPAQKMIFSSDHRLGHLSAITVEDKDKIARKMLDQIARFCFWPSVHLPSPP